MRIPAEGGAATATGIASSELLQNLDVSPDGARVAFSSIKFGVRLWAFDNILSVLK
jgi:hypothetical protein